MPIARPRLSATKSSIEAIQDGVWEPVSTDLCGDIASFSALIPSPRLHGADGKGGA
jgi:hypothetical protein